MTLGYNKYTVIWYLKIQRKCYIKKSLDFFFNALKYPPLVKQWIFSVSWKKRFLGEKKKTDKQIYIALMATLGLISKLI